MKKIFIIALISLFSGNQLIKGQFVILTAPIFQGVYQRDMTNYALIPIVGQVAGPSGLSYKIECITKRLDQNGNAIANTTTTDLITNNAPKGIFNGSLYRLKGWYSIEIKTTTLTSSGSSSFSTFTKCGVGDVFIIAGQSNGQGVNSSAVPSLAIPEWIVGVNQDWQCRKEFEPRPILSKVSGYDKIGPAGYNSWCYGVLGKHISDNNQNMPVAFFNTCLGGSSVKNWSVSSDGLPTNLCCYNTGQVCDGYNVGSPQSTPYYEGQPYLTFKNTLNWYVPLFGVRAVLWHQGEADAQNPNPNIALPGVLTTNSADYTTLLNKIINKSRTDLGNSDLSWMIAQVSYSKENTSGGTTANTLAQNILNGQVGSTSISGKKLQGPLTDKYLNSSTNIYRNPSISDQTHFDELYLNGVSKLAELWTTKIDPTAFSQTNFTRISSAPVPTISIAKVGTNFTFTVATGASAYCWTSGATLAPPVVANSANCLGTLNTLTYNSGNVRCYVKNGNNWQSSAQVSPQINCTSCREGVEENDETYDGGVNMKLYPNPSDKDFRVEFDVLEDDTHVKLEFFDMMGNSVKVIADGSHAKGHFNYPITEALPTGTSICQLKVGEIFISKKMMKVN